MTRGKWIATAAAGTAAVAAAAYYLNERNTEKPDYDLLVEEGPFALRGYPAMTVAESELPGQRETALGNGFRVLADYVFARSRSGAKLAMTAPVMQLPAEREDSWITRFVMPKKFDRSELPAPPAGVTLRETPARKLAAVRFSGSVDPAMLAAKETALNEWLVGRGLAPAGPAEYAFYNSPFIPGILRRNEVLIPVA